MTSANLSSSSTDEDELFSSQFAALLKPIRELTKQGCWELNIADKLDEYIHYIQDLPIEVNVNGEQMKLDFAKAAMVVQNTVQIYSKKVENLWLLLQDVIEYLSSHGNTENNEDNQTPSGLKLKKISRKRFHKGDIALLEELAMKFRKAVIKSRKKSTKDIKRVQNLPHEILHLEEIIGNSNPHKIKLYTLSNEHLGYSSDLRSNFPFGPSDFFLKIDNSHGDSSRSQHHGECPNENMDRRETAMPLADQMDADDPNTADDWQNDREMSFGDDIAPPVLEEHTSPVKLAEEPIERMQLRQRNLPPIAVVNQEVTKDPWEGMEPYMEDDAVKKPCGAPIRCRIPLELQKRKRKEVGKDIKKEEAIVEIDEYLAKNHIVTKKPVLKYPSQPESEFWEDYVHFTKTTGNAIKRQLKLRPEKTLDEVHDDSDHENRNDLNHDEDNCLDRSDASNDDFHFENPSSPLAVSSPNGDHDESKDFFELVQQFMAEYTASAKAFVTSTESTRRVQAWHEMIQPRLREAELRRDFDIHLYGSRVLENFGNEAPPGSFCSFSKIVSQQPKNEVARYFLATLQLANAYNVEIQAQPALAIDGVELKLLSRERHHEHMDDFI